MLHIKRSTVLIKPDINRVMLLPLELKNINRIHRIIKDIIKLSESIVTQEIEKVLREFSHRHRNFTTACLSRCDEILTGFELEKNLNENHRILLGSYFLKEYSIESAAIFNPSIVLHPDQSKLKKGESRFIISLRATGEGHISSITFRTGVINTDYYTVMDKQSKFISNPDQINQKDSGYEATYDTDTDLSERIIFPFTTDECNGIEDARFVKFDNSGEDIYFATYTAYDGHHIVSKLLRTKDFQSFFINNLSGSESKNKGMALFPRRINNKYVMLSRQDAETNFIMYSDDLYNWNSKKLLSMPEYPWELTQIGNCGSPLETDYGWLVLTHGVGPVRKYSIGAILLDLKNPAKVIGRLDHPLLEPDEREREGYVPNVVYSCGSIIHNEKLILPYAMSDYASGFAVIDLNDLIQELLKP